LGLNYYNISIGENKMEERDLSNDLKINKFKLEDACEIQPSLYMYYAEELATTKVQKDIIDDKLDFVMSEVELAIREKPPEGIKITESTIKSLLVKNSGIQRYKEKLRKAKEKVYYLEAAVKALEHRKHELNNLVTLYVAGYYSKPVGKRENPRDQARKKLKRNLNKKGD